jgi:DNA-binding CsgD family transcriptional regulator
MNPRTIQSDIVRLCHSGLDSRTLRSDLLALLGALVPFDYVYFSTTDPATYLSTSSVLIDEPPDWMMPVFVENEFLQDDFNKFSDMIRARQSVGILGEATGGNLSLSPRYRDMLSPVGMGDELRAIFAIDGVCWGTLCLHREAAYVPAEADIIRGLAPHIAEGLRKALLLDRLPQADTPDGPGVLILSDDLSIAAMTPAAEYWLGELAELEKHEGQPLPLTVLSVVASLRAAERGAEGGSMMPRARLRTRARDWLMVYASRLKAPAQQQISVIFETARPAEIVPIILQAYNLTPREGEIVQCVLRGWATAEIAARLVISGNTVQDHLKAIFEKVDVGSRGELAARIFTRQFNP